MLRQRAFALTAASLAILAGTAFAQSTAPTAPAKPAETKPVDVKPVEVKPVEIKPAEIKQISPADLKKEQIESKPTPNTDPIVDTGGRITIDSGDAVELGNIPDTTSVTKQIKFTNNGTGPLEIRSTTGSCGCTVPKLDKTTYQPGESGFVTVTYNPANRSGAQHTTVTIATNDPTAPTKQVQIKSNVVPQLRVEPMALNMGQVARVQGAKGTVTVTSRVPGLTITGVTPNNPAVEAKILETKTVQVDGQNVEQTTIEVGLTSSAVPGPMNANVSIRTSDPNRTLNAIVMGEIIGDIQVMPSQLQFPGLSPSQAINSQLRLVPRNGKAFKVLSVEDIPQAVGQQGAIPSFMKFEIKEDTTQTPSAWNIVITGTAPAQQGPIRGEMLVTTDNEGSDKQMRVRYFGFTRAASQPAAQPAGNPGQNWDQKPSTLVPEKKEELKKQVEKQVEKEVKKEAEKVAPK